MEKVVFLFTGQGAQYVGMAKTFYDESKIARQTFEEANDVLGFDLAKMCFEGSLSDLARTENTQPALLTASIVAYRVYMEQIGFAPQFCAGHSLGEYSALVSTGAIKFADGLRIVRQRGILTKKIVDSEIGAMTIIDGLSKEVVEAECKKISTQDQIVVVNCYNSPTQFAIAGHRAAVETVESNLLDLNAQVTPLFMSAPFHTPLMESARISLKEELEKCWINQFKWPIISNVTGLPYKDSEKVVETLSQHMVKPVQWQSTMNYLKKLGVTMVIEMGPKNVLTNLVKANTPDISAYCYGIKEDRKTLLEILSSKGAPNRKDAATVITKCLAAGVATPNQNFNNEEYYAGVVEPYKKIEKIQEQLEKEKIDPSNDQMRESLQLLGEIFKTKKVDTREQIEWFNQIIDETGMCYELQDFEIPVMS